MCKENVKEAFLAQAGKLSVSSTANFPLCMEVIPKFRSDMINCLLKRANAH